MGWIPVDKNVIYKLPPEEQVAYLALRCAIDDGKNPGLREFSRMQKWGRKKTQNFFKKVGYSVQNRGRQKGDTQGDKRGTLCSLIFFDLEHVKETKGGHSRRQKGDTNINTNTKNTNTTTTLKDYCANFDEIWARYPAKKGRKAAQRSFKASVKTEQDQKDIHQALDVYLKSETVRNGYVMNGSTWFNNWRDYITDPVDPEYKGRMKRQNNNGNIVGLR